ncbi:MAG: pSer/pThr/pTyr-binding forkhead associated (FHA) protein, partial [Paracoccaceae bacterium]
KNDSFNFAKPNLKNFMSSLNIVYGEQVGTHFDLSHRPLSLGREASRDIQITDPKVSRKHALIKPSGDSYVIQITEGKNPIKINGKSIADEAVLVEGDLLTLGDTLLFYTELQEEERVNAVNERKVRLANDRTIM